MKTRTVVIGLVVLVVGIALLIGGALGALGSITISSTFTQPHPGEFVSAEIVLNTTSSLAVSSPAATGGLVHASDLGLVNSTNIGTLAIPVDTTGAGSDIYRSLSGDFYYVAFASSTPGTTIVATAVNSSALGFGSLVLLGLVLIIAGIVVAVVGVFQKKKLPVPAPA